MNVGTLLQESLCAQQRVVAACCSESACACDRVCFDPLLGVECVAAAACIIQLPRCLLWDLPHVVHAAAAADARPMLSLIVRLDVPSTRPLRWIGETLSRVAKKLRRLLPMHGPACAEGRSERRVDF